MVGLQLCATDKVQCKYFMHSMYGCTENTDVSTLGGGGGGHFLLAAWGRNWEWWNCKTSLIQHFRTGGSGFEFSDFKSLSQKDECLCELPRNYGILFAFFVRQTFLIFCSLKMPIGLAGMSFIGVSVVSDIAYWLIICGVFYHKLVMYVHSVQPVNVISWAPSFLTIDEHSHMQPNITEF
jgi:hypothetical protein